MGGSQPIKTNHRLGSFYTRRWLAELTTSLILLEDRLICQSLKTVKGVNWEEPSDSHCFQNYWSVLKKNGADDIKKTFHERDKSRWWGQDIVRIKIKYALDVQKSFSLKKSSKRDFNSDLSDFKDFTVKILRVRIRDFKAKSWSYCHCQTMA